MEQNKSFDPIEPAAGQPYTPNTQPIILNTQQAAPQAQPTAPYMQPAAPPAQPAVQNIQTETHSAQAESHPAKRIVSVLFSAIEIILGIRLILKLLGANAGNSIIKALYDVTGFFVKIFEGIFSRVTINESSGAVFEPATLIAMVVIALIAWIVLKLMTPRTGSSVVKTEYTGPAGQSGQQK
jgi:YGGT family